jgi:hypothetical protein
MNVSPKHKRVELVRQVGKQLGDENGVIVFDPSGFPKSGKESVGNGRQWCGRLGKVDNCQVAITVGYVSAEEHPLVDTRLFLPKDWTVHLRGTKRSSLEGAFPTETLNKMIDVLSSPIVAIQSRTSGDRFLPALVVGKGDRVTLLVVDRVRIKIVVQMYPVDVVSPYHVEHDRDAVVNRFRFPRIEPEIIAILLCQMGLAIADVVV